MKNHELTPLLYGVNHAEVARRCNMTRAYISAIARGERLATKQETVDKIKQAIQDMEAESGV